MARDRDTHRTIARNRKARHLYHVLDEAECGIVLSGTEVKSLRGGHGSLQEAYGRVKGGELWLVGANIPPYTHGNVFNHEPVRDRKLLLQRRKIDTWARGAKEKGTTIVPLELYFRGHLVKVRMALVRGKKLFDKRQDQKAKTAKRDMDREMGRRR
jgi:SsrA-binding protein